MAAFARHFKRLGLSLLALCAAAPPVLAAAPSRIVSTSLCGDAYVWTLAKPQDIAALSWQAGSKLSAAPAPLRAKNKGRDDAERLLALAPSLVVLGPGDAPRPARLVQQTGAAVFALKWVENFDGVYANLAALGKALGRQGAARIAISRIRSRLAALHRKTANAPPHVLYLAPGGSSAGTGTYVDVAIAAAGGRNYAALAGLSGWGRVPLEKLALDPPDLIITSFFDAGYASVTDLRSRHPLLQKVLHSVPTARIPAKDWICAGPLLIDTAEAINAAMRALPSGAHS